MKTLSLIYPPRPKGKISPKDLLFYEKTGHWFAQRKFRGSRALVHISADKQVTLISRHGKPFHRYDLDSSQIKDLLNCLDLEDVDYWLDGELMNKDKNSKNEIIFFDVLCVDKYLFHSPTQIDRMKILEKICGYPKQLDELGISLVVGKGFRMAEFFDSDFELRFQESLDVPQLEGLVLRQKNVGLDNRGLKEYTTSSVIRCRKPFSKDKGYNF